MTPVLFALALFTATATAADADDRAILPAAWITALCVGLGGIIAAYKRGQHSSIPQPLAVRKTETYVTREELEKIENEMRHGFESVERRLTDANTISRTEVVGLHQRIDKTQSMVSEQGGKLTEVANNVHEILRLLLNQTTRK